MEEQILRSTRVLASLIIVLIILVPSSFLFVSSNLSRTVVMIQTQTFRSSQIVSEPLVIDSDTDFVALGATGVGSRADPYVLEDLVISTIGTCITVTGTTSFFTISNCILESDPNNPVIQFNDVENGQIVQCEIAGGSNGVDLQNSVECSVANTTIYACWIGILMDLTQNCTVSYSRIFNNHRGLFFDSGEYTRIENNTIFSNAENGLEFAWTTSNNSVVGNLFGWNGASALLDVNAVDHGEDNRFDDGISRGNEWSDFNGTIPFPISGTSGNNDSYAELVEDERSPLISDLMDTAIDVETSGNVMTWLASDDFPNRYRIEVDGNTLISSSWNGGPISVNLDTLAVGSYRFTATVYDAAGNSASDAVFVSVVSFVLGGIGTELVMIASGLTVVIFLVVLLIIKKLS